MTMRLHLPITVLAAVFLSNCSGCSETGLAGDGSADTDAPHDEVEDTEVITWARTYGTVIQDNPAAGEPTSDGGYIVAGSPFASGGGPNFLLVKLDAYGTIVWQKAYDGAAFAEMEDIHETSDGGFIMAGSARESVDDRRSFVVMKLDSDGGMEWDRLYGVEDNDFATAVRQTSDNGYVVTGYMDSSETDGKDIWVLRLNIDGNVLWQMRYSISSWLRAFDILETMDGGFFVAGNVQFPMDFFVMKLDSGGVKQWARSYGSDSSDTIDSIVQTGDGGIIAAGITYSSELVEHGFWIIRLTDSGDIAWQKAYGGDGMEYAPVAALTQDGGVVLTGKTDSFGSANILVLKLDDSGNIFWQRTYGGDRREWAESVSQTADGGYIIIGETESYGAGIMDFWVLKVDADGNIHGDCPAGMIREEASITVTETLVTPRDISLTAEDTHAEVSDIFFFLQGFSVGSEAQCE